MTSYTFIRVQYRKCPDKFFLDIGKQRTQCCTVAMLCLKSGRLRGRLPAPGTVLVPGRAAAAAAAFLRVCNGVHGAEQALSLPLLKLCYDVLRQVVLHLP